MTYAVDIDQGRVRQAPDGLTPYSWRGICRIDGCTRPATDPHHVVPRGRTGGPVRYIVVDGHPVPNVAGLCAWHHDKITEGRSVVVWEDYRDPAGWWYRSEHRYVAMRPFGCSEAVVATGGRYCPHCGRPSPRRNPFALQRRVKRRVAIDVPVDNGERGDEVLESLIAVAGERLGIENPTTPGGVYHVVVAALAGFALDGGDAALGAFARHRNGNGKEGGL